MLQQDQGKGLQPIAFLSKKMIDAETRYPVHEQELLAIIQALTAWRHYLHGSKFMVRTDHKSLQYFQTQPMLSGRQARWKDVLAELRLRHRVRGGQVQRGGRRALAAMESDRLQLQAATSTVVRQQTGSLGTS